MRLSRTFVAGGSGMVGTNLVARMQRDSLNFIASWFAHQPIENRDRYLQVDLTDFEQTLEATRGCDSLVACVGYTSGLGAKQGAPTAGIGPNLAMHANVLEAIRIHGMRRAVILSSGTVYQDSAQPLAEDDLDCNLDPPDANLFVGHVNRVIEQLSRSYQRRFGLDIAILRPSSIYGPHDHFDSPRSHVVPSLIRRALSAESPFRIWGAPHITRDFVYVDDVVDAALKVLNDPAQCDPLNVGGVAASIDELARLVLKAVGLQAEIMYDSQMPIGAVRREFDSRRYRDRYPSALRTPLAEGLERTTRWYRQRRQRSDAETCRT